MDAFLQSLCLLQEMGKLEAVQTICISFPYTSLVCGSPLFLFEVYPAGAFPGSSYGHAGISGFMDVSWVGGIFGAAKGRDGKMRHEHSHSSALPKRARRLEHPYDRRPYGTADKGASLRIGRQGSLSEAEQSRKFCS